MARDGGVERSSEVKAEMMAALKGLEDLIKEGRGKIAKERSRQEEVSGGHGKVPGFEVSRVRHCVVLSLFPKERG